MTDEIIPIDRYEAVIESGQIRYYAISGKKRYPMPDAYKGMYDDDHLAITMRTLERPELFDTPAEHYIPLMTKKVSA